MNILPTSEDVLVLFEKYNLAIRPMHVVVYVLALAALFLVLNPARRSGKFVSIILSFFWLWSGIVFCFLFWGPGYPPAYAFGVLIVIQGLFFAEGAYRRKISFRFKPDVYSITGVLILAYAAFFYPLIGYLAGHGYPRGPILGVAPCPTTIFTFGLLMMARGKVPRYFLVIPLIWALSGFIPVSIGIVEDTGLILTGIVCTVMILYRDAKQQTRSKF